MESAYPVLSSSSRATRSRQTWTARKTSRWTLGAPSALRVSLFHRRASVSHPLNPIPPSASYGSGEYTRSAVSAERDRTSRTNISDDVGAHARLVGEAARETARSRRAFRKLSYTYRRKWVSARAYFTISSDKGL